MKSKFLISIAIPATILLTSNFALACGCGCMGGNCGASNTSPTQVQQTEGKVQCPVMKNWILASEAADKTEYNGKTYYFCCGGCKEKFLAEPEKYIESKV